MTDRRVASLDLEGITNNYKTWNHLTVCKQINLILFKCPLQTIDLKSKNKITDLSHILYIYLNVCKQVTDVELLLVHSSIQDCLTVCKQMRWIEWFV